MTTDERHRFFAELRDLCVRTQGMEWMAALVQDDGTPKAIEDDDGLSRLVAVILAMLLGGGEKVTAAGDGVGKKETCDGQED